MVFELKNPLFRAVFGVKTKKSSFFVNFFSYLFVSSKNSTTFALAFGKQRGNAVFGSMMILENIPYRQAVQRSLFENLNKEIKCKVRNEKRTVNY